MVILCSNRLEALCSEALTPGALSIFVDLGCFQELRKQVRDLCIVQQTLLSLWVCLLHLTENSCILLSYWQLD